MDKMRAFLQELGFRKNEIEVYIALVMMKESSVLQISKKTSLHRSNIYDALDSLMKRGLVFTIEDPVKKYISRDPQSLLEFLKRMQKEFEEILKEFKNNSITNHESNIKKSGGKMAIKQALFDLLLKNKPIYSYGISSQAYELLGPSFDQFHLERVKKLIPMKVLYNNENRTVDFLCKLNFTEARSFTPEFNPPVTTTICGDEVILISWEDEVLIQIKGEHIADSYKKYFDILWNKARNVCKIN